ncbi:MAG: murein L,D-transpeptidase catalytic domain family protein [Bdellovibrionaceae bacterium]|nr:murein L,D-transpeptidase catalytic domain family protein [Pseudobdellovibrionaceae bacterium]
MKKITLYKSSLLCLFSLMIFSLPLTYANALGGKKPTPTKSAISPKDHTVKTLPEGSKLALTPQSSFYKTYITWRDKLTLDPQVWDKVFLFLDKNHEKLDPKEVCLATDNKSNREKIRNLNCLVIVDYTKSKMEKRLHLVDLKDNKVHSVYTAHGKGSNIDGNEIDLTASRFSNTSGSLQTSLGFYLSAEPYNSYKDTFGPGPQNGIKLDGISCTNNNARKRYIVMHTAKYVPEEVTDEKSIGYSEGCITFTSAQKSLMHKCMHGALVYAHGN